MTGKMTSDKWDIGPIRHQTNETSDQWDIGPMRHWTNETLDQWDRRPIRTNETGDQWNIRPMRHQTIGRSDWHTVTGQYAYFIGKRAPNAFYSPLSWITYRATCLTICPEDCVITVLIPNRVSWIALPWVWHLINEMLKVWSCPDALPG